MDPQNFHKTPESINDLKLCLNPLMQHPMNKLTPEELLTAFHQSLHSQWKMNARDAGILKDQTKFLNFAKHKHAE